jgi:hypothetical protein
MHATVVGHGTSVAGVERSFFHQVLDAFEGFAADVDGELHSFAHRRGLKVWYDNANREHYEAQLVRLDGEVAFEVGFHAEYPKPAPNQQLLERLVAREDEWRSELGDEAVAGEFLGSNVWRRISEVWEPPDPDVVDAAIEVAARLADYVIALEPLRRATRP